MPQIAELAATAPMHENREWPRYAAQRSFTLSARLDGKVLPCRVEDVSLGGARLIFDDAFPGEPGQSQMLELSHPDAQTAVCEAVWQNGREIGVRFDFSEDSLGLISVCIRNIADLSHPGEL